MKEEKTGTLAELIFHNEENFYTILLFETEEEQFFAVENMPSPKTGRGYRLTGEWKNHPKYGEQFAFSSFEELKPTTAEGIVSFLSSGVIGGIGPKMAAAIVRCFGSETLDIIENQPERLTNVPGIGKAKAKAIIDGYAQHREYAETVISLAEFDITGSVCFRLYKTYGKDAVNIIRQNPYTLISDIYGIGFKKADKIAESIGLASDDPNRVKSGIIYCLSLFTNGGDSYTPKKKLTEETACILNISREKIAEGITELVLDGRLAAEKLSGEDIIMLPAYFRAEKYTARKLIALCKAPLSSVSANPDTIIKSKEESSGIKLSEKQKRAVLSSIANGVLIITGGPGTGKSTIINSILDIYQASGLRSLMAAPTGRAAKRMQETTGRPASTIHRLLEYAYAEDEEHMIFGRNEENPLDTDCVIIDEFSMVDILLFEALLRAIKPGTRLILVGDADQLPPVGAGSVLKDTLDCGLIPSCRLTDIFRQAAESAIVVNAHLINKGEYPVCNEKGTDFFFLKRRTDGEILSAIIELCKSRLPSFFTDIDAFNDIQVLTPTRKGPLGSPALNAALQEALNPPSPEKHEKQIGDTVFREGDKVMQTKNNYMLEWKSLETMQTVMGVFNGEMGIIDTVDTERGVIGVIFDNEKYVNYDYQSIQEVEPAYAITVHKSQGSEFPVVVMPMAKFPPMLSTRNLLYTAITRAKQGVVLVGNPAICNAMTDNNNTVKRNSGLAQRILKLWDLIDE